jgi:hypothetical protein
MFTVNAIDRQTGRTAVENYATFDTYQAARAFADRQEMAARACGWTWTVAAA